MEDTGWWRGSNLYLAEADLVILDEGQGGCVAFRLNPVRFDDQASRCPERLEKLTNEEVSGGNTNAKSDVYSGMRYLGRFNEALDKGAPVELLTQEEAPEIRLPAPI
ncbi:hypothetical protein NBRC116590_20770 [Pelagimonas sp. KU-00592-HH]